MPKFKVMVTDSQGGTHHFGCDFIDANKDTGAVTCLAETGQGLTEVCAIFVNPAAVLIRPVKDKDHA